MKFGFFGNTNNYPFMLAQAIRTAGHEVRFLVDSDHSLHRPEGRYADIGSADYSVWVRDITPLHLIDHVYGARWKQARQLLADCDVLVLNGLGPALACGLDKPSVVLLTGSDIEVYANWNTLATIFLTHLHRRRPLVALLDFYWHALLVLRQRRGIRSADAVNYFAKGLVPTGDALLEKLLRREQTRIAFMMTDIERIVFCPLPDSKPRVRIFNVARLNWSMPYPKGAVPLDYKGTDVLLRGIHKFVTQHGGQVELVLVRKGLHVTETEALVRELGLSKVVSWLDEMSQDEVLEQYRQADIVSEQLTTSVIGMGGLDAMATGRPLIANSRHDIFGPLLGNIESPVCHATCADEVCAQLERLVFDRDERIRAGIASRRYVEACFSATRAAQEVIALLEDALQQRRPDEI